MSTREFDDIIKQKAQRRQADVPPDIWDNISNRKKKKRSPFFWLIFLALLVGSSVAVWKIKNGNNDVAAVATEKTKADKKSIDKKREEVSVPAENGSGNQPSLSGKIKTSDTNEAVNNTTTQAVIDLNTNNNAAIEKEKILSTKKQLTTNTATVDESEKTFLQNKYKRNTKGKYTTAVRKANADELHVSVDTKNVMDANETKTKQFQKNTSIDSSAANNSIADISIAATVDNNKTNAPVKTMADSSAVKKIAHPGIDSVDKNETSILVKKIKKEQKNTSLKIEARARTVFPVQQYEQSQTVQRILNTANATASFTSNKNITTSIEGGNGLSISLVKILNNRWSIGAGISYMRFTEQLVMPGNETNTEYHIVQRLKEGPNGNYLAPDTLSNSRTYSTTLFGRNIYHNVGIPLYGRYRFIAGKKLSCELTTGFTVNLLRKYSNNIPGEFTTVYADGSKQSGRKNSLGLDISAALLFSGNLYRKYEWFAAAEYAYNLSAYKNLLNKKIHLPGVSFGVLYELRK